MNGGNYLPISGQALNEIGGLPKKRLAILTERYWQADAEGKKPKGARNRSKTDFRLMCWLVDCGISRETAWDLCRSVGKYATNGQRYFETTYTNVIKRQPH